MANRFVKAFLIAAGGLSVGLAILGIFLPLLPTTPFLLLAAACFARSSQRLYRWLHGNRWFGAYLRHYRAGQGIPRRVKIITIVVLWLAITVSIIYIALLAVRILLIVIAVAVTIHVLRMKTLSLHSSEGEGRLRGRDYSTS